MPFIPPPSQPLLWLPLLGPPQRQLRRRPGPPVMPSGLLGSIKSRGLAWRLCDDIRLVPLLMYRVFQHLKFGTKQRRAVQSFVESRRARQDSLRMANAFRSLNKRVFLANASRHCARCSRLHSLRRRLGQWRTELGIVQGLACGLARKQRSAVNRWLAAAVSRLLLVLLTVLGATKLGITANQHFPSSCPSSKPPLYFASAL